MLFDVGANVGDYCALGANLVGPMGHVYAFEPAPHNVAHLRARFAAVPQVTVIAAAVGDASGVTTLYLDRCNATRHSLAAANVGKAGEAVPVQQVTLDAYCDTVARLDVVKIDAQRAELHILRGASRLLATFRPYVTLELWPVGLANYGGSARAVLDELKALDYTVHRLSAQLRTGRAVH